MAAVLADLVVILHLAFVVFVVLGGLLVLRWPRAARLHLPAALWGVLIEFAGWVCPLTPLEQWLRQRAGERGYEGGFIEHYVTALIYPEGLTRQTQLFLGLGALIINVLIYSVAIWRWRHRRRTVTPRAVDAE